MAADGTYKYFILKTNGSTMLSDRVELHTAQRRIETAGDDILVAHVLKLVRDRTSMTVDEVWTVVETFPKAKPLTEDSVRRVLLSLESEQASPSKADAVLALTGSRILPRLTELLNEVPA